MRRVVRRWCLVAGVASFAAAEPLHAQEEVAAEEQPTLEEEILVVARRAASPAGDATPSVSRWSAQDVERRQAVTVAEVLAEAPGTYVLPDGPLGQFGRVFVRGGASNHTLVLVDGIPQNDATTGGGFDFNDLTTTGVERIELLRGSYGVLYGSEALGGVVSVETRRGGGPTRGFLRALGGSFDTHRESAGVSGGDECVDFAVTASSTRTRGERDREDFRTRDAVARVGSAFGERLRLDASFRVADSRVESPYDFASSGVLPEDPNIVRGRRTLSGGATLTWDAADWLDVRLSGSVLDVDSTFENGPDGPTLIDPDFTPGSGDEFSVIQDELLARNDVTDLRGRLDATASHSALGLDWELTGGAEWLRQESDSSATFPDFNAPTSTTTDVERTTRTRSFFALAQAKLPAAVGLTTGEVLTAGVRHDDHSVFGGESSPHLGARVDFVSRTTLRSAWGEGFRAPKPSELDDAFVGNEDLGPETSDSFDVGASQSLFDDTLVVGVTWFRLRTEDLIAFDATATTPARPFGQLVNFARTETRGFEYEATADLGAGFRARASFTSQNPRDRGTGRPLPNRARQFGSVGVSWEDGPVLVSVDGFFSGSNPAEGGEFTDPDGATREQPGRRHLVNLTARWRATDSLAVFARIENLLDDEWVATPSAPRGAPIGAYVGAQLDF